MNIKNFFFCLNIGIFSFSSINASALESACTDSRDEEQDVTWHDDETYTEKCKKVNDALALKGGDQFYQERSHIIRAALSDGILPNDLHSMGEPILFDPILFSDLPTAQLLLDHKADPQQSLSATIFSEKPILFHAKTVAMAQLLLSHKANVHAKDRHENTLLHQCAYDSLGKNSDVLSLISLYASLGVDPCAINDKGETPICLSAFNARYFLPAKHHDRIEALSAVGVPMHATIQYAGVTMTFIQNLKVMSRRALVESFTDTLSLLHKVWQHRQTLITEALNICSFPQGLKFLILSYDDPEKFNQTEDEMEDLSVRVSEHLRKVAEIVSSDYPF